MCRTCHTFRMRWFSGKILNSETFILLDWLPSNAKEARLFYHLSITVGRKKESYLFQEHQSKGIRKQPYPRFELGSSSPFLYDNNHYVMITVTPYSPPYQKAIYDTYIYTIHSNKLNRISKKKIALIRQPI